MTTARLAPGVAGAAPAERYVVLGNPVAHSQSPFIHAAFARQTGEPVDYDRLLCAPDGFEGAVRDFAAGGGRGCNVTLPFKFQVPALAQRVTARATLAQAANVLRFDADGWLADNTDGIGLVRDIEDHAGWPLAGQRVLLIGAGGGAAGALGPLIQARPRAVQIVNRSPQRAFALAQHHADWAQRHGVVLSAGGLDAAGSAHDIVLNASASSLQGAAVPVPGSVLAPGALALDLMYGDAALPFMAWARAHGAQPRDGLGMLVEQAAAAFHLWGGVRPDTRPVLQALRARLAAPA